MSDWASFWLITPTLNVAEALDILVAGTGIVISVINRRAAQQRLREWVADGRNGVVERAATTAVHHETLRLAIQVSFLVAMAVSATFGSAMLTPAILVYHAALLTAMVLVMAMSVSSLRSRRAIEREARKGWDGTERRRQWDGTERRRNRGDD